MEALQDINWFGHASFSFLDKNGNHIYYIDPFELPKKPLEKADIIFITHVHSDHLSPSDLMPLIKEDTIVVAPIDCLDKLDLLESQKYPVLPHKEHVVKGVEFVTIPAYNTDTSKRSYHPKENNWVGYVITINDQKIYHAGDTDIIPEMETLSSLHIDVALLPIGGTYTMDVTQAAQAANMIHAKITIPMHYKKLLGDQYKQAEEQFKKLVTKSKVVILPEGS